MWFTCIFLMVNNVEHLFMYLLAIWMNEKNENFSIFTEVQGGNVNPRSTLKIQISGTDVWAGRKFPLMELKHILGQKI